VNFPTPAHTGPSSLT